MTNPIRRVFIRLIAAFTVLAIVLHCAQAAAVQPGIETTGFLSETGAERGLFHDDKKYGDGSLKKFFFMLKVILKIFGKH